MSRIYYRGAKAAVVCYDLTDKLSYEKAQFWVQELLKCGEEVSLTRFFFWSSKSDMTFLNYILPVYFKLTLIAFNSQCCDNLVLFCRIVRYIYVALKRIWLLVRINHIDRLIHMTSLITLTVCTTRTFNRTHLVHNITLCMLCYLLIVVSKRIASAWCW